MQITIAGVPLVVNLADDAKTRVHGLKGAESMDQDVGMLFRWPEPESRSFWMKDTDIPLDIAFIDDKGAILNIERMKPLSLKSVLSSGPASCALEVNHGWFKKNNIQPGDIVKGVFNNMPSPEPELTIEVSRYDSPGRDFDLSSDDFYYQEVVDPVVNDIMKIIPGIAPEETSKEYDGLKYEADYDWEYPVDVDVWTENWTDEFPGFEVEVIVIPTPFSPQHPGWNVDASAGYGHRQPASVEVQIKVRPGLQITPDIIISLEAELSNAIAHELHHLTQHESPLQRPNCTILPPSRGGNYYDYFTSSCETPAFLMGFRAEAAKTNSSISDLIDGYLKNYVNVGRISNDEAEEISKRWLNHSDWSRQ